ncbi:MAG: arginase family protein [Solirubrobacterales bacterium]
MSRPLAVIGVPTSAGAFAPGQEQAPAALREAGLIELLRDAGLDVRDHGDREPWRWRPDRENPRAQNLDKVVEIVTGTAARVADAAGEGATTLVLGGDCTVGLGTVAGHVQTGERVGLVYFDAHADMNLPRGDSPGALDWTGVAHMLGEPDTAPELAELGSRTPLLEPEQVVLLGWDSPNAQPRERETVERRSIDAVAVDEVRADPAAAARRALELLDDRTERVLVHFDVDVVDFTDTPLSENPGRNEGVAYDVAIRALEELLRAPALAGVTVTELNPAHAEEGAGSIERLARDLARAMSASGP